MGKQERELIERLLANRIGWLRKHIDAQDTLSKPVAPGHWRWADLKYSGYGRKSEEELAQDRAAAAARAEQFRSELSIATSAWQAIRQSADTGTLTDAQAK